VALAHHVPTIPIPIPNQVPLIRHFPGWPCAVLSLVCLRDQEYNIKAFPSWWTVLWALTVPTWFRGLVILTIDAACEVNGIRRRWWSLITLGLETGVVGNGYCWGSTLSAEGDCSSCFLLGITCFVQTSDLGAERTQSFQSGPSPSVRKVFWLLSVVSRSVPRQGWGTQ
jgi:hypothetical protein